MSITANELKTGSKQGIIWRGVAQRAPGYWTLQVDGYHNNTSTVTALDVTTRNKQRREWRTLDALYRWCIQYDIDTLTLHIITSAAIDRANHKQTQLDIKPAKQRR